MNDIYKAWQDNASQAMPYFRREFFKMAQAKGDLSDEAYLEVRAELRCLGRNDGIDKCLSENRLDAIIVPTEGSPAFVIDPVVGDNILSGVALHLLL